MVKIKSSGILVSLKYNKQAKIKKKTQCHYIKVLRCLETVTMTTTVLWMGLILFSTSARNVSERRSASYLNSD